MHHLGCGIWSQIRRSTGASLNGTRPAQMNTSAWRGEKLCRSMPKRAMSNRLAAVAMYSMAQHAVPNGMGHSEFDRAQLARKSRRGGHPVGRHLGDDGRVTGFVRGGGIDQSHCERSALPDVDVPHREDEDEDEHFDRADRPAMSVSWRKATAHGIMNTASMSKMMNSMRDQVELDREPIPRVAQDGHARLVRRSV